MAKRDALRDLNDTIAAVSTAPGRGGRAIVRLSGRRAFDITREACKFGDITRFSAGKPGTCTRYVSQAFSTVSPEFGTGYSSLKCRIAIGNVAVPCVLYLMPAPRSYTREDVAELHTFGAQPLVRAVMDRFLKLGARPAEPGEFTKRAFINGRIDLAQAEAVSAVIRSRSAADERAAQRILAGELSENLSKACERLEGLCVKTEASIDLVEHDIETITPAGLAAELHGILRDLPPPGAARENIQETGITAVITGKTNAGKSTLFNALCEADRALVSDVSGTTRDWLFAEIEIGGITFALVDTAGECASTGEIDRLSRDAGRRQASSAQITILVIDGSKPFDPSSERPGTGAGIVALNKSDLPQAVDHSEISRELPEAKIVPVSALSGNGIDNLRKKLVAAVVSGLVPGSSPIALSARQQRELADARNAIERGIAACRIGLDLVAGDIRDALTALGSVFGWGASDEILNAVFREFCVGK